jgi:chemotaxis protein CheX
MDSSIVAAFSQAAKDTFRDMFSLQAGDPLSRELKPSESHEWDLSGLMGLAGHVQGVVALRLTKSLAEGLLAGSGVVAGPESERAQLESGLVGEIINIIAGAAVSALSGLDIEIAPPVVVRGANHQIGWPAIGPVVALSFALPEGKGGRGFELDLCIKA